MVSDNNGNNDNGRKKKIGVNDDGYLVPRFNLENKSLAWLKEIRSVGSRAVAKAVLNTRSVSQIYGRSQLAVDKLLVSSLQVEIQDLPPELEGIRIIQLTDIHHGPWLPIEFVREVIEKTNSLKPDIIVLTGDYVVNSPKYIDPVAEALGELKPSIGMVGVLGNHDWWEGGEQVRKAFKRNGIALIDNSRRVLTPARKLVRNAETGLVIAGVGDPWAHKVDFDRALTKLSKKMPRIVLSHNPDCAEDQRLIGKNHRVDFMVSGHTHGGQVCFPGNNSPVLPRARKSSYTSGLVNGPVCPVYVSKGIGTAGIPLRLNVEAEIAVFDLTVARASCP